MGRAGPPPPQAKKNGGKDAEEEEKNRHVQIIGALDTWSQRGRPTGGAVSPALHATPNYEAGFARPQPGKTSDDRRRPNARGTRAPRHKVPEFQLN